MLKLLAELVRKDLRIYVADRKSVMISFMTPVILACFVGFLMTQGSSGEPKKVPIYVVDQDHSDFSKAMVEKLKRSDTFEVTESNEVVATSKVKGGTVPLAIVITPEFGKKAAAAMMTHTEPPEFRFLADPTRAIQVGMAQGGISRVTMQVLPKIVFGAAAGSGEDSLPFQIKQEFQTSDKNPKASMSAHAFAGMGIQGLLFWAIESAMTILRERRQGIWKRLRASPVSPWMFILGKAVSASIRALVILTAVFGVGMALFHFQIRPELNCYLGFVMIAFAVSIMTACFGLLVASLGRTEQQSRGLSILAVLGMSMLGGAWFPLDMLPNFMQTISKAIPIAWAINGFDDMIWRGGGIREAVLSVTVLLAFAAVFVTIALRRIRWEPEAG
jgi:ABC-2 type transport system permease protein